MATTDAATVLDLFFIKDTYKYYPKKLDFETLIGMAKDGIIQRDRFVEMCMSNASDGKYTCVSENGRDHCDDSDTKTVTIQHLKKKGKVIPTINIKHVGRKKGALRVVAFDPKFEVMRYFYIWALPQKSLNFGVSEGSKYINGQAGIELNSFSDLAKHMKEEK
jgi:hypothetical protein